VVTGPHWQGLSCLARYLLEFGYDGSGFSGLMGGAVGTSVDHFFAEKLRPFDGFLRLIGFSGRTDRGVHAHAQVAVIESMLPIPDDRLRQLLGSLFSGGLILHRVVAVSPFFHPRGSARYRQYTYWVAPSQVPLPLRRYVASYDRALSFSDMQRACQSLLGTHDFSSFSCRGSIYKSSVKRVIAADVVSDQLSDWWSGSTLFVYRFCFVANSFLYRMVRSLVAAVLAVGDGSMTLSSFLDTFRSSVRPPQLGIAPACGLVFEKVYF